ncbi:RNA polymerase sigma factor SigJ [Paenibacillus sp.]|uniref:RNA polymerase sigma factor SigJ n=1 Tax=Paenibacillus sp. TaxID=58172 RepID=UPI002D283A62|nr:RNA polymerase sigma factor SigJ [Paenibacillus sp.]HZG83350.1 RNA polymerase sigma factor SigJ [Paenibacillus sp.]
MVETTDDLYVKYRPLLFSIAYRMTGLRAEAEDVVQDVFLQWARRPPEAQHLEHPKAYLCRMTVNRCTDLARSARARRLTYFGPWLPEPLVALERDPAAAVEEDETLSFAMLLLMEKLRPVERAVFVLREAFGFEYADIAGMIDKTEANVRQIVSRVRAKLDAERPADAAPQAAFAFASELLAAFHQASSSGNLEPLMQRLAPDVVLLSDGGGKAFAAPVPIVSRNRVAAFLGGLMRKAAEAPGKYSFIPVPVNGGPGLVVLEGSSVSNVMTFAFGADGAVHDIYIVRNPDKLRHVSAALRIP